MSGTIMVYLLRFLKLTLEQLYISYVNNYYIYNHHSQGINVSQLGTGPYQKTSVDW